MQKRTRELRSRSVDPYLENNRKSRKTYDLNDNNNNYIIGESLPVQIKLNKCHKCF
jgi:hypothetical protein